MAVDILSWIFITEVIRKLEKAMAPHSSTLAWKIPWTEEPGRLQSKGSRRVRHNWMTSLSLLTFMHWRRKWQPTPVLLPGESQGWEPGGLSFMGSHRVRHDWCDLAAAAAIRKQDNRIFIPISIAPWVCIISTTEYWASFPVPYRRPLLVIHFKYNSIETQRDGMGREVGGGIGMGNTCKSMADSCQCMAKTTTIL